MVDSAVSALFTDLEERGLLDTTLVVLCGEFSRTPKMNDGGNGGPAGSMGTPGRDHWGNSMFCLLGGGGVKGGQIVGSTDRLGTAPHTRPVTPANIHATIYNVLGIDPTLQLLDPSGRPVNGARRSDADRGIAVIWIVRARSRILRARPIITSTVSRDAQRSATAMRSAARRG